MHTGTQNHPCQACGRQCVLHADNRVMAEEPRPLVERLRRETISRHGMCRAVGASIRWLMDVIVARLKALPDHWLVPPMASPGDVIMGHLQVEADEMWSVVQENANKPWVWIAMDK